MHDQVLNNKNPCKVECVWSPFVTVAVWIKVLRLYYSWYAVAWAEAPCSGGRRGTDTTVPSVDVGLAGWRSHTVRSHQRVERMMGLDAHSGGDDMHIFQFSRPSYTSQTGPESVQ